MGRLPRGLMAVVAAVAMVAAPSCGSEGEGETEAAASYVEHADEICAKGRSTMRSDPAAHNSTRVAEEMQSALRDLGEPPSPVSRLAADVPELLAVATWAAASFQRIGLTLDDGTVVRADDLVHAGFHVCGTR